MKVIMLFPLIILTLATEVAAHPLSEAIQKALDSNPQVHSAKMGITIAKEQLNQARAAYLPTVDLALMAGEEHTNKPLLDAVDMWKQDHTLTLNQKLFDGWATQSVVERSEKMLLNAKTHLNDITGTITLNVIESWYELFRLQRVIQYSEKNVAQHKKVFSQIRQKVQAGAAGQVELAGAEGPYIVSMTGLIANKGQYSDALARYSTVVGERPADALPPPDLKISAELPENVDLAVEQAMAVSAAVLTSESNLLAAKADHRGANAGMFPTLDFELKNLLKNDAAAVEGKESGWTALLKVNYNLFRGGSDTARRKETATAVMNSQQQLDLAHRSVEEMTRIFWGAIQVSRQILRLSRQQLKSATQTRNSTSEQFKMGETDIMAIMGAEDALFAAQQGVLQEEITGTLARYRLLNQLGILTSLYHPNTPEQTVDSENLSKGAEKSEESSAEESSSIIERATKQVIKQMEKIIDKVTPAPQQKNPAESIPTGSTESTPTVEQGSESRLDGNGLPASSSESETTQPDLQAMAPSIIDHSWGSAYKLIKEAGWRVVEAQ
jgi:outer membrane protein, adhesin transport system